jgi:carbamoylphosphate synthase large subunit
MKQLDAENKYIFHELLTALKVKSGPEIPAKKLHQEALERLRQFPGSVDAIVGYWDFPVSTMLPLLRVPFGLPSPSFESVLKCEHKYWSRLEQSRVIPEYIPDFCAVDPFAENYQQQIKVDYPFWIKPVKSVLSHLGFKINNDTELHQAITQIRENIFRYARPFNYLLQFAELPGDVAQVDGNYCIVESIISQGRQCTLEGYVYHGEMVIYGVVDSIREGRHRSSFSRYQYPSNIPCDVQQKMIMITERFIEHIGFDNGPFNIEFYWERDKDRLWLLEINTRISKSHSPLFRDVDGASNHKVMLELGLGIRPDFPHLQGDYRIAAKFMWREYEDALVERVPSKAELLAIQKRFPGTEIQLHIEKGMKLSSMKDQDSYSYETAVIFLGGNSEEELLENYHGIQQAMHIELVPVS